MATDKATFTVHPSPELEAICGQVNAGHAVHEDTVLLTLKGIGEPIKVTLGDVINGHAVGKTANVRIESTIGDASDPQRIYEETRRAVWDRLHPKPEGE